MLSAESEASLLYSAKHVLPARAKLNLSLSVLGRRADGYHDLQSVMVTLALADEVRILTAQFDHSTQRDEIADGSQKSTRTALDSMTGFDADAERSFSGEATALDWRVSTNQPTIPDNQDNIAWKAALAFCRAVGISPAAMIFSVDIVKNIPQEAGLGGGSANAAAVLRYLYRMWHRVGANAFGIDPHHLTHTVLEKAACTTGADVPFCLRGGIAFCEGVGERMTPLTLRSSYPVLLAIPPLAVKTADAYKRLHRARHESDVRLRPQQARFSNREALIEAWQDAFNKDALTAIAPLVNNDFVDVTVRQNPAMIRLFTALQDTGAPIVSLSGSGPACYALFEEREACRTAKLRLQKLFPNVRFISTTLSPEEDVLNLS